MISGLAWSPIFSLSYQCGTAVTKYQNIGSRLPGRAHSRYLFEFRALYSVREGRGRGREEEIVITDSLTIWSNFADERAV